MSSLRPGDQHLHHADGSHRWSGGPADARGREAYLAALRDHVQQHRGWSTEGTPRPDRRNPDRRNPDHRQPDRRGPDRRHPGRR